MDDNTERRLPEDQIDQGVKSLREAFRTAFLLLKVVMVLVVAAYLLSGLFKVKEHQSAVVLRFGKFVLDRDKKKTRGPGLHTAFPYPVDEKVKYDTDREREIRIYDTYMYAGGPGREGTGLNPVLDGHALTGDLNVIHYKWSVRYE